MPIACPGPKLLYFPVPKNACSSIKNVLWEFNEGRPFSPCRRQGREIRHIHQIYVSMRFSRSVLEQMVPNWRDYFRFAVVRDPVKRLVSAYRNRVLFHRELDAAAIEKSGLKSPHLSPRPDFTHFVKHLPLYRQASGSIAHHTDPQEAFIGDRLDFYDLVCGLERIGELERELGQRVGHDVTLPVLQNLGPSADKIIVDDATEARIRTFYRRDYALLRDFYS